MKKYAFPSLVFFLILIGTLLLQVAFSARTAALLPGEAADPDYCLSKEYVLYGERLDPNTVLYRVRVQEDTEDLVLLLELISGEMEAFRNGESVYTLSSDSLYRRIHEIPLGKIRVGEELKLEIRTARPGGSERPKTFLTSSAKAKLFFQSVQKLNLPIEGVLLMSLLFSLLLFIHKPSEKYLLLLVAYTLCLFFLISPIIPIPVGFYKLFYNWSLAIVFSLRIGICLYLVAGRELFIGSRRFPIFGLAAFILLFYLLLSYLLSGTFLSSALINLLLLFGAFFLIRSCGEKKRDAWPLLCLLAITQGMQLYVFFADQFTTNLFLIALRSSKAVDLPLLLGFVYVLCSRFAGKFVEQEALVKQLDRANAELDIRVEQATRELKLQQEQNHKRMTNIFHDLRSPLFILRGFVEMMESDYEGQRDKLPLMRDRLEHLIELSEDLFLLAKLEDGKVFFGSTPVDVSKLASGLLKSAEGEAARKGICLKGEIQKDCTVWGDKRRLEQMLQNLLQNALNYTPAGKEVNLRVRREKDSILAVVADTGRGIREEDLPHVFQRYYSAEPGDASSGLGLSIAYEIARHHKGNILVESSFGEGSVFTVRLPCLDEKSEV